jgi:O-methyltransferase
MSAINKEFFGKAFPFRLKLVELLIQNSEFVRWSAQQRNGVAFNDNGRVKWDYPERVVDMYEYINDVTLRSEPLDYLEFGVYRGRTMKIWTKLNPHPQSRFIGFDSFEGLPEDWSFAVGGGMKAGTFSLDGKAPQLDDPRVTLVKGLFQHTLPDFIRDYRPQKNVVVHMDADLYTSTLFCLAELHRALNTPIVIFDEFDNLPHEYLAFRNYTTAYRRNYTQVARFGFFKKAAFQLLDTF